jgi:hypothetical protein
MDEAPPHFPPDAQAEPLRRSERHSRSRTHRLAFGVGLLGALGGVLLLVLAGGVLASILGAALIGLSAIAFVSLMFLYVGESEEDDRLRHPRG